MPRPTYPQFVIGAVLGACVGVWVRAIGGLALNGFTDWPHFTHFLFSSSLIPTLSVYAATSYIAVGSLIFFWARQRQRLNLWLFAGVGAAVGYLASYPMLLVPSWASVYVLGGLASGIVGYAVMRALAFRSPRTP